MVGGGRHAAARLPRLPAASPAGCPPASLHPWLSAGDSYWVTRIIHYPPLQPESSQQAGSGQQAGSSQPPGGAGAGAGGAAGGGEELSCGEHTGGHGGSTVCWEGRPGRQRSVGAARHAAPASFAGLRSYASHPPLAPTKPVPACPLTPGPLQTTGC